MRVGPPRRSESSYEAAAHWTGPVAAAGDAVLRLSAEGPQTSLLRLQVSCQGHVPGRLGPAGDLFLARLAHLAEARALTG